MASQGKGGKIKGEKYERDISKLFTKWWNKGNFVGEFYRTPASGGLQWQNRDDVIGDLCTPEGFIASVECKNQEQWKFKTLFTETIARKPKKIIKGKNKGKYNSPSSIGEYWFQAVSEGIKAEKIPLLIFSKNYQKSLIMFPMDAPWRAVNQHKLECWGVTKKFKFKEVDRQCYEETMIVRLDKFLEIVEPKLMYKGD